MKRSLSLSCCIAAVFASSLTHVAAGDEPRFLRVVGEPAKQIALEIASVDMHPGEGVTGPRIGLIGVAHIGDGEFYAAVQKLLDTYEIVLFEAVQPIDARVNTDNIEALTKHTRSAMHFVASAIEAYKEKSDRYPSDLASLQTFIADATPIVSNWLGKALTDAWGQPLKYEAADDGTSYQLTSNGGPEPIDLNDTQSIAAMDLEQNNLQQQLADALSLEFQLRSLGYEASNWRPSDMSVNELNAALAKRGVDFAVVGGTLAGTSFPARLVGGLLRLVAIFDAMAEGVVSDMMKVMMIEMLGNERVLEASMGHLGEAFAAVIIDERNQVVIDDLKAIVRDEQEIKSVAVLYGAAHLPDLVERLEIQMGYELGESQWLPAISVNIAQSQMDARQVQRMRAMVQRMIQQQMPR